MDLNISNLLEETRNSLLRGAAAAFISAVIIRIFAPKPTLIQVDEGIPAELYAIGKRGNPKAVYVTTHKRRVNIFPAVMLLGAAAVVSAAKKQYDKSAEISV